MWTVEQMQSYKCEQLKNKMKKGAVFLVIQLTVAFSSLNVF